MYRDFQSRNVMISQESPRFIDFQGGRRGPVLYDVASFLWQAKANFPDNLRRKLAEVYRQALQAYCPMDAADFENQLRLFVLFRTSRYWELTDSEVTSNRNLIFWKAFLMPLPIFRPCWKNLIRNIPTSVRY